MDIQVQMAYEFASELSKQLITLATGVLALTITFTKDIVGRSSGRVPTTLLVSWLAFLVSIVCGVWHMSALTGSLENAAAGPLTGIGDNARNPAAAQVSTFLVGLVFAIVYGKRASRGASEQAMSGSHAAPSTE